MVACALLAAPLGARAADVRREIEAANARWAKAIAAKDPAGAAALYAEDAVIFPPGGPAVSGRKAIAAAFEPFGGARLALTTSEVTRSGDYAIESGTWTMAGPDGAVADEGKYVVVWKRVGKSWLFWRDIWNGSRPPAKP